MKHDSIATSLGKIFSLKHILFSTFDTSSLALGLNKTEERVLMMAWHRADSSMRFLSREAGMEKGSLTTVIDSLEARGLVRRDRDEADRRSFIVRPTDDGCRVALRVETLFRDHLDALLKNLSTEDQAEFERAAKSFARLIPLLKP